MAKEEETKIIAYKGFDKDLKCRGFQYEIGKEYELPEGEEPELCKQGFHACESPLNVFDYYFIDDNAQFARFCEVEQSGVVKKKDNGEKNVSSKIKIKAELKFADFIKLGVERIKEKTAPQTIGEKKNEIGDDAQIGSSGNYAKIGSSGNYAKIGSSGNSAQIGSSGNYAQIGSSGYSAQIGSSGDDAQIGSSGYDAQIGSSGNYAKIGSSGNYAKINSTGNDSVIMCAGNGSIAKAKKGSWITLAEWYWDDADDHWKPKCVKTEYVDGRRIMEDTWYKLVDGEFKKEVVEE